MPGPLVHVIPLAPAHPAPSTMPTAANSSSACITAHVDFPSLSNLKRASSLSNNERIRHECSFLLEQEFEVYGLLDGKDGVDFVDFLSGIATFCHGPPDSKVRANWMKS